MTLSNFYVKFASNFMPLFEAQSWLSKHLILILDLNVILPKCKIENGFKKRGSLYFISYHISV